MQILQEAINELFDLAEDNIYSMAKLEWWLLKHEKTYVRIADNRDFNRTTGDRYYFLEHEKYPLEVSFLKNFYNINGLSRLHRFEQRIKTVLEEYNQVKNDYEKSEKWIIKYNSIWNRVYYTFLFDNMDENIFDTDVIIHIKDSEHKTFKKYISREDFKYTLEFVILYNDVYSKSDYAREKYEQELRDNNGFRQ